MFIPEVATGCGKSADWVATVVCGVDGYARSHALSVSTSTAKIIKLYFFFMFFFHLLQTEYLQEWWDCLILA
jgi:hypothetical protein